MAGIFRKVDKHIINIQHIQRVTELNRKTLIIMDDERATVLVDLPMEKVLRDLDLIEKVDTPKGVGVQMNFPC